jgi:hypothetical protein
MIQGLIEWFWFSALRWPRLLIWRALVLLIAIPIAILHVKYLWFVYLRTMNDHRHGQSNDRLAKQRLRKSLLMYYASAFDSWGWLHFGKFSYSDKEHKRHIKFMRWLKLDGNFVYDEWGGLDNRLYPQYIDGAKHEPDGTI